jgi:hypothetical protein
MIWDFGFCIPDLRIARAGKCGMTKAKTLAAGVRVNRIGSTPLVIEGDLNHDCMVDYADLGLLAAHWLEQDCLYNGWCYEADLNYDGKVDFLDFALFAQHWLEGVTQ